MKTKTIKEWEKKLKSLGYLSVKIDKENGYFEAGVDIEKWVKKHNLKNQFKNLLKELKMVRREAYIDVNKEKAYFRNYGLSIISFNELWDLTELVEKEREQINNELLKV